MQLEIINKDNNKQENTLNKTDKNSHIIDIKMSQGQKLKFFITIIEIQSPIHLSSNLMHLKKKIASFDKSCAKIRILDKNTILYDKICMLLFPNANNRR